MYQRRVDLLLSRTSHVELHRSCDNTLASVHRSGCVIPHMDTVPTTISRAIVMTSKTAQHQHHHEQHQQHRGSSSREGSRGGGAAASAAAAAAAGRAAAGAAAAAAAAGAAAAAATATRTSGAAAEAAAAAAAAAAGAGAAETATVYTATTNCLSNGSWNRSCPQHAGINSAFPCSGQLFNNALSAGPSIYGTRGITRGSGTAIGRLTAVQAKRAELLGNKIC